MSGSPSGVSESTSTSTSIGGGGSPDYQYTARDRWVDGYSKLCVCLYDDMHVRVCSSLSHVHMLTHIHVHVHRHSRPSTITHSQYKQ